MAQQTLLLPTRGMVKLHCWHELQEVAGLPEVLCTF
jgi:hypothetical protein